MKGLAIIFSAAILSGCASNVVYERVNIPTKCDIDMPSRPDFTNQTFIPTMLKDLLIYTEALESALKFCITNETN